MVPNTPQWIGGLNYFVNLSVAIQELPDPQTTPVIIGVASSLPPPLNNYKDASWIFPRRFSPGWFRNRIENFIFKNNSPLGQQLARQGIDLLLALGIRTGIESPVPTLEWIADFQHRHLPEFFTQEELDLRNEGHDMAARDAHGILVSSETARDDLYRFNPEAFGKAHVLRFVANILDANAVPTKKEIERRYKLGETYFHLPNQLWAHKNHKVVVEALRILKDRGKEPLVISTGHTEDYRNPGFFKQLGNRIEAAGVTDRIRFLGVVPFADLSALMRYAVAMINPSLFEGWSTTVEEAKSIGKKIILSDIPVHREQTPERGIYFPPDDAGMLADLMTAVIDGFDPTVEARSQKKAAAALPLRRLEFAETYEGIVKKMIKGH